MAIAYKSIGVFFFFNRRESALCCSLSFPSCTCTGSSSKNKPSAGRCSVIMTGLSSSDKPCLQISWRQLSTGPGLWVPPPENSLDLPKSVQVACNFDCLPPGPQGVWYVLLCKHAAMPVPRPEGSSSVLVPVTRLLFLRGRGSHLTWKSGREQDWWPANLRNFPVSVRHSTRVTNTCGTVLYYF